MRERPFVAVTLGFAVSAAVHVGLIAALMAVTSVPEFEFELEIPDELELGMTDEMEAAAPNEVPIEVADDPAAEQGAASGGDAGVPIDAGPPDAGRQRRDAGPRDAGVDAAPDAASGSGEGEGVASRRIPPGAQIAIRLDLAEVRASALRPQVAALLDAIPDWHLLLDGSGIDTIEDLDRLLIASPDLRRTRIVLAGKHSHDEEGYVREVVTRYSAARDAPAPSWRDVEGIPVADWPNPDSTERVVAILGPRHFTISRPQDLERVLAIAHARELAEDALEEARGADALLSMGEGEAVSFEVEGAQRFARGNAEHVPERLRFAVRELESGQVEIRGSARFEDDAAAAEGRRYWDAKREEMTRGLIGLLIYGRVLRATVLDAPDGREVPFHVTMSADQARTLLESATQFIVGAIRSRQRAAARREARSAMSSEMSARTP